MYPGCSPYPGDGGSWNNIDNLNRLHFHGTDITVVRCGNIDGIEPGSESPATPVNFIEFTGTGWLKGIKGNKADYGTVHASGRTARTATSPAAPASTMAPRRTATSSTCTRTRPTRPARA